MTSPEQFYALGCDLITQLAQVAERLRAYSATFEARGGAAALDDYGDDTLGFVYLNNDLQTFFTPERKAILDKHRNDY